MKIYASSNSATDYMREVEDTVKSHLKREVDSASFEERKENRQITLYLTIKVASKSKRFKFKADEFYMDDVNADAKYILDAVYQYLDDET